jgi:hypothetical protein
LALQRGPGLYVFLAVCVLTAGYFAASRLGYVDRLQARFFPTRQLRLSA